MRKYNHLIMIFLFVLAVVLSLYAETNTSPTYDDNPPAYIWGTGTTRAQTSGNPTVPERVIIENISIDTQNIDKGMATLSTDLLNIDSRLYKTVGSETKSIADFVKEIATKDNDILEYLNATFTEDISNIAEHINNIDEHLVYYPEDATDSVNITALVASQTDGIINAIDNLEITSAWTASDVADVTDAMSAECMDEIWNTESSEYDITTYTSNIAEILAKNFGHKTQDSNGVVGTEFAWDLASLVDYYMYPYFYVTYNVSFPDGRGDSEFSTSVVDELISRNQLTFNYLDGEEVENSRQITVADALTLDSTGSPTHVLGRILDAVESQPVIDLATITSSLYYAVEDEETGDIATYSIASTLHIKDKDTATDMNIAELIHAAHFNSNTYTATSTYNLLEKISKVLAPENDDETMNIYQYLEKAIGNAASETTILDYLDTISQSGGGSTINLTNIEKAIGADASSTVTVIESLASITNAIGGINETGTVIDNLDCIQKIVKPADSVTMSKLNIVGLASETVIAPPTCSRKFIELRADNEDDVFYISFNPNVPLNDCRPCRGRFMLECNQTTIYVKAVDNITLFKTEGMRAN